MAKHLTLVERERISQLHFAGCTPAEIGRQLGRHRCTVGRELKRNTTVQGYLAHAAQGLAERRRANRPWTPKAERPKINRAIRRGLVCCWSPDEIAARLRRQYRRQPKNWISAMSIYRWIGKSPERAHWESFLRRGPRRREPERRGKLKATASIAGRPKVVDRRGRFGDWEGDTVVGAGRRGALVTLVERKSGFALIALVKRVAARNVGRAAERLLRDLPAGLRRTATFDNGKEFAHHRRLSERTGLAIYFARPYHSWERGCNEHFNGLLRQYFPKGTDFTRISPAEVKRIQDLLNDRPRKRHGYRTPREALGRYHRVAIEL